MSTLSLNLETTILFTIVSFLSLSPCNPADDIAGLLRHWSTWITEDDIRQIAAAGKFDISPKSPFADSFLRRIESYSYSHRILGD